MSDTHAFSSTQEPVSPTERLLRTLQAFLERCEAPALTEPGETIIPLQDGSYSLDLAPGGVLLECWGDSRVLRRRITAIQRESRTRLDVRTERFGQRLGTLSFLDGSSGLSAQIERESTRGVARERFRRWCERLHPDWRFESLSTAPDLERSLSPRFPRALLRRGNEGICAIAAPQIDTAEDLFTFALIWLHHCRTRVRGLSIKRLLLIVPESAASQIGLRLMALDHVQIEYRLVCWTDEDRLRDLSRRVWGNLDTVLHVDGLSQQPLDAVRRLFEDVAALSEAECVREARGGLSLEVRGLPIAHAAGDCLRVGLKQRVSKRLPTVASLLRLCRHVAARRKGDGPNLQDPLYRLHPERWLESVLRRGIRALDPCLSPELVRRQVRGDLGTQQGRTDLLALDETGRLVIIEVKADTDLQLPAQALDYYIRLRVQLERGDFHTNGLFPGREISPAPPKVLLVAPALAFHPAHETVLGYLESSIQVLQIGIAIEWRKELRVVFQHPLGPNRQGGEAHCPLIFSSRSVKRLRH